MPARHPFFATATRGTEDLLARELESLGAKGVRQDRGGVRFLANWHEALRVCLWTRLAVRVLQPLAQGEAQGADGLYAVAHDVSWEEHLTPQSTFAVEALVRDSEHVHSGFVALKIKDAVVDRLRDRLGARPDVDTRSPDVRVVAHLKGTALTLSLDLCGDALHRRGYRVLSTRAPLKETLAAAVVAASGYQGDEPVVDPMCGSGTLLIEAAWLAQHRAPGLDHPFGVERWPHVGASATETLRHLKEEAHAMVRPLPHPLRGYDKDPDAVKAARKNAASAGLSPSELKIDEGDATQLAPPEGPAGLLLTNPPYGDRLGAGGQKGMKTFYFKLGESFAKWKGWRVGVLSGNTAFESAFHQRPSGKRPLWNGAIACEFLTYPAR